MRLIASAGIFFAEIYFEPLWSTKEFKFQYLTFYITQNIFLLFVEKLKLLFFN